MPTRFWGINTPAAAIAAAMMAANATADVMGSPAVLKTVKVLAGMISPPSLLELFHD
jgi:hypothetical protein